MSLRITRRSYDDVLDEPGPCRVVRVTGWAGGVWVSLVIDTLRRDLRFYSHGGQLAELTYPFHGDEGNEMEIESLLLLVEKLLEIEVAKRFPDNPE